MYKGTIIENSLRDKGILGKVKIERSWEDGEWRLYDVLVAEEQLVELPKYLADGPWYIHLWQSGKDEVKVIFKDKLFTIKHSDKSTWSGAIAHGQSIGIPLKQLDFPIN